MNSTWEFLKTLTNPESILHYGGLALLVFVIFAETGLLIGFFLPGDSLVFIAGLFCATKPEYLSNVSFPILLLCLIAAAFAGNMVGYWFGKKTGEKLFTRDDNLIFKKRYVNMTSAFYARHGKKTLILGRFLPVIRTFAPILAGVIKIDLKRFMLYNLAGAVLWLASISSIGFFLGRIYPGIEKYLGYIVIGLIIITTIPVVRTYMKEKKRAKETAGSSAE
jgi:membrane-associated protein